MNAFERVSKAERYTASKARLPNSYAVCKVALIVSVLLAASLSPASAQTISLGAAQNFSILGGSTVTNTGATSIVGNIGVSPGTAITGFPPGVVSNGAIHSNDALASQAHADAFTAYTTLVGEVSPPANNLSGQDLGSLTLNPGVYHFNTSAQLTGTLLLNTTGNPTGTFIFQIGSTLTTASNSAVTFVGPADPNIFWQIGSSATLGTNTQFDGNLVANTSITLTTGANITAGRALAINGAVTMDTNFVNGTVAGNFWKGGVSNLWSGLNWSPDATGATSSTLASGADVVFSVTGIQPQNQNTVLDVDETISSLTVNDPAAVTISGPHTLSITGTGVGNGITINSGAGLVTINSNLLLSGLPEIITVNSTAGLVINGIVGGTIGLTKAGTGRLTLSGANTYTGGTTINAGTLQIGNGFLTGSILGPVVDNGALVFDRSDGVTFGGVISGTGSLTQSGGSPLILTGDNTYAGGTTISAGKGLVIGDGGTIGSIVGNVTDNGFLTFNREDNITFSGTISGTGILRQQGPGTLTLTGVNSYMGGTALLGGTLSVDKDAELGGTGVALTLQGGELLTTTDGFDTARAVDVAEGKGVNTLAAETGTTATYTGVFSDIGGLTVGDGFNDGKVVLASGANTYFGGTTVLRGATLSVNTDAELGNTNGGIILRFGGELLTTANFTSARSVSLNPLSAPNFIVTPLAPVSRNILAAAANTTATYTGLVFGTGGLAVGEVSGNNPGVVVLANLANSFTGGTLVQGGATLSVANDTNLGDPTGGIILATGELLTTASGFSTARAVDVSPTAGRNILAAANGTTATYTGVLSDGGTLVVGDGTHAGTVLLAGTNTYSGGTVIDLGTLIVDNGQALGTGNVTVNGGVLAADPQPINVLGDYTQNAGGTLQLNVAGRAIGQFDVLNVTGNAALNGTLRLINQGYQPQSGDKLRLVTTGGSVSGRFAQFQNPFALAVGFNTIDLVYARQSVTLEFLTLKTPIVPLPPGTPGPPEVVMTTDFASFACTPNGLAAANLLDAVQLDQRAANLISFLDKEPFANLCNDFDKISPEGLTAFYEISFSNSNIQRLTLEGRLDDIHNGSNGFSSNMKVNGATVNDKAGADGKSSKAVVEPVLQHAPENRWGVWVTGFGDFVNVDGDGNAQGYNFTTGGASLGIDFRITDQLAIGVMGEYSHTWTSLNPSGHIDVDSGRGGLYATWFSHGLYINGAIYGGHNNYDSGRAGLGGLANGSTEGAEWSTFIGGGFDFHFGPLTIGPIASLQYTDVGIDSFSEKGSLAPLAIHSDSAESLRSDVGFRLFYQWQIGKIVLEPSLKAAWEHEYKYSALPITASFAGIPGPSATFFGPNEGHDSAVVSAGVSAQWTPAISTYINYDGQLGRDNYDSNAVTGGVRVTF